ASWTERTRGCPAYRRVVRSVAAQRARSGIASRACADGPGWSVAVPGEPRVGQHRTHRLVAEHQPAGPAVGQPYPADRFGHHHAEPLVRQPPPERLERIVPKALVDRHRPPSPTPAGDAAPARSRRAARRPERRTFATIAGAVSAAGSMIRCWTEV